MQTISLKVSPSIAKAYEAADMEARRRLEILVNVYMKQLLQLQSPRERLLSILEKGAAEAKNKGFTPDLLDDLLKDDE
jgi:hypothetical protein